MSEAADVCPNVTFKAREIQTLSTFQGDAFMLATVFATAVFATVGGDDLLTIRAAGAVAHRTPNTITRWIRAGELPATGEGRATRILRTDLLRYLTRGGPRSVEPSPEARARAALERRR